MSNDSENQDFDFRPNVHLAPRGKLWTGDRNRPLPFGGGAVSAIKASIYRHLPRELWDGFEPQEVQNAKIYLD